MVRRLCDYRVLTSWPPLVAGARFTQPRDHSLDDQMYVQIMLHFFISSAILSYGGPGPFGANQEGISLLISVTYEFIQLIAYF